MDDKKGKPNKLSQGFLRELVFLNAQNNPPHEWRDSVKLIVSAFLALLKTSSTRFSILLAISTALWLSLLSGNLWAFLNPIKLVTYFCQPGLV